MVLPEFLTLAGHLLLGGLMPLDGIPDPAAQQPPGTGGVTTLMGWLKWIGFAVAGGAVIVGGILVAVSATGGHGDGRAVSKLVWPFVGAIIIGGGIGMMSMLMGG